MSLHDATSLGEASTENKGHGPETSRDADGQDRYSRHKALSPVAEGNTDLPLYVPWCQNSTREGAAGVERGRVVGVSPAMCVCDSISAYALPVPPFECREGACHVTAFIFSHYGQSV